MRPRWIGLTASGALLAGALLGGVTPATAQVAPASVVRPAAATVRTTAATVSASALLAHLRVKAHTHRTTYRRTAFRLWIDADHDGENTRAEVLVRQSTTPVTENAHHTVLTGRWTSPYDGKVVTAATKLQIDHVVPLENAWISGAASWSAEKREAYANDLGFAPALVAVSIHQNERKGDRDPAQYLPPKRSDDCRYVESWIAVKVRWGLSVTTAERSVLHRDLHRYCTTARLRKIVRPGKPDLARLTGRSASSSAPTASPAPTASTPTASSAPTASASPTTSPSTGSGDQGVVHPGAFCSPEGATGRTAKGTAMVCGPGSDGRDRWHAA